MQKPLFLTLLSSAACLATAANKAPEQAAPERSKTPNVIFIYADEIGRAHV